MNTPAEKKREWLAVEFEVPRPQEEMAAWLMMNVGAIGCQIRTSQQTDQVIIEATFELGKIAGIGTINSALDEYGLAKSMSSLRMRTVVEEDWLSEWKKGFEPFPVGRQLLVCPPWLRDTLTREQLGNRQVVLIEPGLAFGTGFHATTQYCLSEIDAGPNAHDVVDVGTGSGILAIAVALLWAGANITAVETDPLACRVASENFALNNVTDKVTLIEGSTEKIPAGARFDLILSNLTYEDNASLIDDYLSMLSPGGRMIFAGILAEKAELLRKLLVANNLHIQTERQDGIWVGMTVVRD